MPDSKQVSFGSFFGTPEPFPINTVRPLIEDALVFGFCDSALWETLPKSGLPEVLGTCTAEVNIDNNFTPMTSRTTAISAGFSIHSFPPSLFENRHQPFICAAHKGLNMLIRGLGSRAAFLPTASIIPLPDDTWGPYEDILVGVSGEGEHHFTALKDGILQVNMSRTPGDPLSADCLVTTKGRVIAGCSTGLFGTGTFAVPARRGETYTIHTPGRNAIISACFSPLVRKRFSDYVSSIDLGVTYTAQKDAFLVMYVSAGTTPFFGIHIIHLLSANSEGLLPDKIEISSYQSDNQPSCRASSIMIPLRKGTEFTLKVVSHGYSVPELQFTLCDIEGN